MLLFIYFIIILSIEKRLPLSIRVNHQNQFVNCRKMSKYQIIIY